jgi:hypothetical protein
MQNLHIFHVALPLHQSNIKEINVVAVLCSKIEPSLTCVQLLPHGLNLQQSIYLITLV